MNSMTFASLMKSGRVYMQRCIVILFAALMVSCNGSDFFEEDANLFPVTITLSGAISGTFSGYGSLMNGTHRFVDPNDDTEKEQDVQTLDITYDDGSLSVFVEVLLINSANNYAASGNPCFVTVQRNYNKWNFDYNYVEKFAENCGTGYALAINSFSTVDDVTVPLGYLVATAVPICKFLDQETVCTSPIIASSTVSIRVDFNGVTG